MISLPNFTNRSFILDTSLTFDDQKYFFLLSSCSSCRFSIVKHDKHFSFTTENWETSHYFFFYLVSNRPKTSTTNVKMYASRPPIPLLFIIFYFLLITQLNFTPKTKLLYLIFHQLDNCLLSNNIMDYHIVSQGKTTIPNVDDGEEFNLTDVRHRPI